MDFLDALEDEPEGALNTWWITIMDADPITDLPEIKMEVSYYPEQDFQRVTKKFRKRGQVPWLVEYSPAEQTEIRGIVMPKCVHGWSGMCYRNLMRLSQWALRRPQLAARWETRKVVDGKDIIEASEIEFNTQNLAFVAKVIEHSHFNTIYNAASNTAEAAVENFIARISPAAEKKD